MNRKVARDEELKRKRARRYADLMAAQEAARSITGDGTAPRPPSATLNRVAQREEEVRRAFSAQNYDLRRMHQGVGNDAIRATLDGNGAARQMEERPGAALLDALLAREAIEGAAPTEADGDFGADADLNGEFTDDDAWADAWEPDDATESMSWESSAPVVPTHVTVRDQLAGLDVTYDLAGGAPDVDLAQVEQGMGGGAPLDTKTREYMEWRFGVSFEKVRVHTGPKADAMSKALFAHAFALGADVAFQSNAYRPGTQDGDRLLAHELTHVVQAGLARPLTDAEHSKLGGGDGAFKSTESAPAIAAKADLRKSGSVSEPTDSFEVEADNVADIVVRKSRGEQARVRREHDALEARAKREEEEARKNSAGAKVDAALQSAGKPLDGGVKGKLEALFGRSLDGVRVHDDGQANDAAESVQAHAFTAGSHVVFGPGEYRPGTREGDALIAHEVTHVIQNQDGRGGHATGEVDGVGVTSVGDAVEQEAYAVGDAVAAGALEGLGQASQIAHLPSVATEAAPAIARDEAEGAEEIKFDLNLGNRTQRITIPAEQASGSTYSKAINGISGLEDPCTAHLDLANNEVTGGTLRGVLSAPELQGGITLQISASGEVSGSQEVNYSLARFARGQVTVQFSNGAITARKSLTQDELSTYGDEAVFSEASGSLMMSGLGTISARASGNATLAEGKLTGDFSVSYREGAANGSFSVKPTYEQFDKIWQNGQAGDVGEKPTLTVRVADGRLEAQEETFDIPAQGKGVSGTSSVTLSYAPGQFSGGGDGSFAIGDWITGSTNVTFGSNGDVNGSFTAETTEFDIGPLHVGAIRLSGGLNQGNVRLGVAGSMSAFNGQATGSFTGNITDMNDPEFTGRLTANLPAMQPVTLNLSYAGGAFTGNGTLTPQVSGLSGSANLAFNGSDFTADGSFDIALPIVQGATLEVQYADGQVTGTAQIDGGDFNIAGVEVTSSSVTATLAAEGFSVNGNASASLAGGLVTGTMNVDVTGSSVTAGIDSTFNVPGVNPIDLHAEYSGGTFRGSATTQVNIPFVEQTNLTVGFANGRFEGNARGELAVPFLSGGSVQVTVQNDGTLSGTVQVAANDVSIPPLTVTGASVEGSIRSDGHLSLRGQGTITGIPGVNEANLSMGVNSGGFSGSIQADFNVPTMKRTAVTIDLHEDGSVTGSADVEAEIAGVDGAVHVDYADGALSGTGTLSYSRGKFSGSIEAAISAEGELSGTGRVSYAITDDLTVTGEVTLRPDGTMIVGGALECPDRIDLFEKEWKKTIFDMTGRFGIPGLSVQLPVVGVVGLEAQLSGKLEAYANIGLYLADITAAGTFDTANNNVELDVGGQIRGEAAAGVTASARLAIGLGIGPAFIGGYIQIAGSAGIRAGIGAGVNAHYTSAQDLLELGVNVNASAGLEFALEISGGITASVDLWLTKWEHDWPLASKTWNYNPGVNFDYNPSFDYRLGSGDPSDSLLEPASEPSIDGNAMAREAGGQSSASGGGGSSSAQRKADPNLVQPKGGDGSTMMESAAHGISGAARPLPHLDTIQSAFGRHDVTGVQAHTDGRAQEAAKAMGAKAYATGNDVAFGSGGQDLHTAAHEAAHVVQQRAGVAKKGGESNKWEQHADAVADAVVAGRSAEPLLDRVAPSGASGVQKKALQQKSLDGPVQKGTLGGGGVDFDINLGGQNLRISVPVPQLEGSSYTRSLPSPIPGISGGQVTLNLEGGQVTGGTISGSFAWPIIQGDATFTFTGEGDVTGSITRDWNIENLGSGQLTLSLENGSLSGTGTLEPTSITAPGLSVTEVTGSVTVSGSEGVTVSGSGQASVASGMLSGGFSIGYSGGTVSGHIDATLGLGSFVVPYAMNPSAGAVPEIDIDLAGSTWSGSVTAALPIGVAGITGSASTTVNYNSDSGFSGSGSGNFQIAHFFGGTVSTTVDTAGNVGGSFAAEAPTFNLGPITVSGIAVTASLVNGIPTGGATGNVAALDDAVTGSFSADFAGGFSFTPTINVNLPSMNGTTLSLGYDAGSGFSGSATITPSIGALSGQATLSFAGTDFSASGSFNLESDFLQNASVAISYASGSLTGSTTLTGENFNLPHLSVTGSSITVSYDGDISASGSATIAAAGLFSGTLNGSWADDSFDANGSGTLNPPGLEPIAFELAKEGGTLTGSASTSISIPRVQATNLTVTYDGSTFSGGTDITLDVPFLDSATGRVDVDPQGLSGSFAIQASSFNFSPLTVSAASVTGTVAAGNLNLAGTATVATATPALTGSATVTFVNTDVTASGGFGFSSAMFGDAQVLVNWANNRLTGTANITPNDIVLPMISVTQSNITASLAEDFSISGSATVSAANNAFSGSFTASYTGGDIDASASGTFQAPGVTSTQVTLNKQGDSLSGSAQTALNVPLVNSAQVRVAYENNQFSGGADVSLNLPIVDNAEGSVELTPEGAINGSITVEASDISLPHMNVDSAAVTATITNGDMNLQGNATLSAAISALSGNATLTFNGSDISASGGFDLESGFFQEARIDVEYAGGRVTGEGTIAANNINLPNISVTNSSITIGLGETVTVSGAASVAAAGNLFTGDLNVNWTGSDIDGSVVGTFQPPGLQPVSVTLTKQGGDISGSATANINVPLVNSATVTVSYSNGQFGGSAQVSLNLPIVDNATGTLDIQPGGQVGGSLTVEASDIELPYMNVDSASVTAEIDNGAMNLQGDATLSAEISALSGNANLHFNGSNISADGGFDLESGFFESARIDVQYEGGRVTGQGTINANNISLPMLTVTNSSITVGLADTVTVSGSAGVSAAGDLYDGTLNVNWTGSDIDGSVDGTFRPPGITPIQFNLTKQGSDISGSATAQPNIPLTTSASITVTYRNGAFGGTGTAELSLPIVDSASGTVEIQPEGTVGGSITVNASDIEVPFLTVESASVTAAIDNGDMDLSGSATLGAQIAMLTGNATLNFQGTDITGSGGFDIETSFFDQARIGVTYENEQVVGEGTIGADTINLPMLTVTNSSITARIADDFTLSGSAHVSAASGLFEGDMTASYTGGDIDASVEGTFRPPGINPVDFTMTKQGDDIRGSATTTVDVPFTNGAQLTVTYDNGEFSGRADLNLDIPFVEGGRAWVEVTNEGQINGGIEVNAGNVNLPFVTVNDATITGEITNGVLRMEGSGSVSGIPMTRSCDFTLGVNDGNFYGSVAVDLEIPFTERTRGEIEMHEDGSVSGSVNVRASMSGVTGEVEANYDDGNWSGSGTLEYNRGPFTGSITARLSAEGNLSGTGRVSYDITPDFTITAEVTMREDGSMEIGGRIDCPDRIDLFEQSYEKEIFSFLGRFGIPGLSIQLPIVGVVGLEARLSGSLSMYAELGLYLTDIFASGTFDTATNDVELDIGGSIKGRAEAGMIAAIRFAIGLGIGPAFIGGYIEASGKAAIFAELVASVAAHYSSRANSLGLDIDLSANAGLVFELGLEAGLMAEIDLWLFKWSADFPLASKSFEYSPGVSFDYSPSFGFDMLGGGAPSPDAIAPSEQKGMDNEDARDAGSNVEPDDSERYKPCRNVTDKFDLDTEDEYAKGVLRLSSEVSGDDADRMLGRFGPRFPGFLSTSELSTVAVNFSKAGGTLEVVLDWIYAHGSPSGADIVAITEACTNSGFKEAIRNDGWKGKICPKCSPDEIAKVVDAIEGDLELKCRWMVETGTNWGLVLPRVEQAPQGERDVLRTDEWMGIFTGLFTLQEIGILVDLLGGDLTFKWTWLFAASTDYAHLKEKAEAAPQGERDACRGDEWKGQVAGVVNSDQMAELVDIMGGDLHYKWDWMFAADPQYVHIKAKAEAAPQGERDACRGDDWKGRMCPLTSTEEMAELVDIMGGDLHYKWDWTFTTGTNWGIISSKAEAAPQNERDACRTDEWLGRVIPEVSEDEMAQLVDIMGGDLAYKLHWMYTKGSNWGLIQPKVEAAPQAERDAVRNDEWKPRHLGMLVHDEIFVLVELLNGTLAEKLDWLFDAGTHYDAVRSKVTGSDAGQYPLVQDDGWLARINTVTSAENMFELTGLLLWDLEVTLHWMFYGGTTWELAREKLVTAGGGDQQKMLGAVNRLRELEGQFGWNEMAAGIEILGQVMPGAGQIQGDGAVSGAMEGAWTKSSPFPNDIESRHEEGGWIYVNVFSGTISVVATSGGKASIDLGGAPEVGDSVLVGYFHTHPNPSKEPDETGRKWKAEPSPADMALAGAFEVPAFIRADTGVIAYGPSQRPHFAGPKALPGSGSTTAPQKRHPAVAEFIKLSSANVPWKSIAEILRTANAGYRAAIQTDPGVMKWLGKIAPDSTTLMRLLTWDKETPKPMEGGQTAGQLREAAQALSAAQGVDASQLLAGHAAQAEQTHEQANQKDAEQGAEPASVKKAKATMKRTGKKLLVKLRRLLSKKDLNKVNKRKVWNLIVQIVDIWDDYLRADMKPPVRFVKMQAKEMQRITKDPLRPWFDRPASTGKVLPRIIKKLRMYLKTPKFVGAPKPPKGAEVVQKKANGVEQGVDVQSAASQGVSGAGRQLPHMQTIQQSFGHHDISSVRAHTGGQASEAAASIGAQAYAMGDQVAFQGGADLHTAAHEAAHVVQQRAGAQVSGGVGSAGDRWEQHADQVADAVVAGQSAEQLLDQVTGGGGTASQAVQMKASDAATGHLDKGYFDQYKSQGELKTNLDKALDDEEKAVHASFADVREAMGPGSQETPSGDRVEAPESGEQLGDGVEGSEPGAPAIQPTAEVSAPPKPALGAIAQPTSEGDRGQQKRDYKNNIANVQSNLPTLDTSPGPVPPVELTGSSDPQRADRQKAESETEAERLRGEASAAVDNGPGPDEVKEKVVNEVHPNAMPELPAFDAAESIPKADEFIGYGTIPQDVQDKTDDLGKAQIEASLAEASAKVEEAQGKHQTEIEKTKADQEKKQQEMIETANRDMDAEVKKRRDEISKAQDDTKQKQQDEVAKVKTKSETEKDKLNKDIDDRVKKDTESMEKKFSEAEKEASDKKKEAEAEAAKKKQEAEQEAESDSWWDAMANAVASAFDALASAVNSILDAAVEAVNTIVDAAKSFATGLIDACLSFVTAALEAYGDLLKGLVDGLLGDIFPGLAAALCDFIDSAVELATQALNAIGEALKNAVNALLDSIAGALTGLIEAYKAAINAAMALAKAVLTGDWEALGKMILEGVLQLAGIPPADFYALINNAMESIDTIIEDPGGFVGNVINSVGQGFDQFAGNFLDHLQTGFFEWLVGPIGEMGISLPSSWDIVGIFGLTMDVIGLNKEGIQGVVTEELGETAGVVFDYVWRYVEALVTGGIDGLWNEIQNDLSSLWDMVVDGIKNWILETIVTQAVLRIATMFNPVGALLNAVMTAYNVYCFVRDEIARIMGVVTAVVDMIASIAAGNLGPAANAIESALASLIPIAISLLANLLGLGGIANKVKEIIEGVQETVQGALRSLIRRVKGLFQGGGEEETPEGTTYADLAFQAPTAEGGGQESHRIFAEDQGGSPVVMIASEAKRFSDQVNNGEFTGLDEAQKSEVLSLCGQAETKYASAKASTDASAAASLDQQADALMQQAKDILLSVAPETLEARANIEGGMALTKLNEIKADAACSRLFGDFEAGSMRRHVDGGKTVIQAMRDEVQDSGMKYLQQGDPIPDTAIDREKGLSRVVDLPAVFGYYQPSNVQQRFMNNEDAFCAATNNSWFDPIPSMTGSLRGRLAQAWWFARNTAPSHTVAELSDELAIGTDSPQYAKGMIRFDIPAAQAMGSNTFRKPTPYDGIPFSEFRASSGVWGVTAGGALEAVAPAIDVSVPTKSLVSGGLTDLTGMRTMLREQHKTNLDKMHEKTASIVERVFEAKTREIFDANGDWAAVKALLEAELAEATRAPLGDHDFGTQYAIPMAEAKALEAFNETDLEEWEDTGSASAAEYVRKRKGTFTAGTGKYGPAKVELNALLWDAAKLASAEAKVKEALSGGLTKTSDVHKEYKPKNMTTPKPVDGSGGDMEFSYEGFRGAKFTIVHRKDQMVTSITGTGLTLKGTEADDVEGRGYTSNNGNRRSRNSGQNSSHLIPDRLRGSGYKEGANLISTSRHYNVPIMSTKEEEICQSARDAKQLTMSVSVKWMEWAAESVVDHFLEEKINAAITAGIDIDADGVLDELEDDVKAELQVKLSALDSQNIKRVENVTYSVSFEAHDSQDAIPNYNKSTDEWDRWL